MPLKTSATTGVVGTEVLQPCQGFGVFEDILYNRIQARIPLCYSKDRIASFRLCLESIRKEVISSAQLVSRDSSLF